MLYHIGGAVNIGSAVRAAERGSAQMRQESKRLVAERSLEFIKQNECLQDGTGTWLYLPIYGKHANFPDHVSGDHCNPKTPAACGVVERLALFLGDSLLRVGYSVVEAHTRIRPHYGPTNSVLKMHLGLTVPRRGPGTKSARCTSITVAGDEREWVEGRVMLFDDSYLHHVWNNCSSFRSVLQIVIKHPQLEHAVDSSGHRDEL